ncbi:macrophage mannose receptor 1-like [Pholidichthys leucotaenia]
MVANGSIISTYDSPLTLTNKNTGFCLVKTSGCLEIRWTTGDRLLVPQKNKCLGVQGKSVGSEISLYDCDETSELQKWECRNETVLALKGQEFYIDLTADNTAFLSRRAGPNSHLTISETSSGACTRTHRELYTIEGNAAGRPCMFPFFFEDKWYSDCISVKSERNRPWCAVETKFENGLWGFCPTNSKENWNKDATTGMNYQLNTNSALTWAQAEVSCKQQAASLLSITEPHEQAYISALLGAGGGGRGNGYKLWTGLILDPEHGWQWSDGRPYRYLNWDSGYPNFNPGHICGIIDGTAQYSWQSSKCDKKLGYICYSKSVMASPTEAPDTGFCSSPWIPYNGHCFYLNRTQKSWSEAQSACRKEGGDLASIHNVEEQSFVVSQLGYASRDELWIGLNDKKKEGLFDWCDYSTVSYTSWEASSPTVNSRPDCVLMRGQNGNWADRDCKEKHGFICMKKSASEPTGDEVEQNVGCKTGWKRYGSYCYFVGTETKTFDEADKDCKSSDSYLADVSSGVDNVFLVSLVGLRPEKHFWLGLSNQKHLDFFEWTNTDSVRFTHWNAQMPGHYQGCVAMATGEFAGLWDLLPCTNKEKYICKHLAKDAVLTPAPPTAASPKCADGWTKLPSRNVCYKHYEESSKTWFEATDYCRAIGGDLISIHKYNVTSDGWLEWNGNQYYINNNTLAMEDARSFCKQRHGDLIIINSEAESTFLFKQKCQLITVICSMCSSVVKCQISKQKVPGFWRNYNCGYEFRSICKRSSSTPANTTVAPTQPPKGGCQLPWKKFNSKCYSIFTDNLTWDRANQTCKQMGGNLASISSRQVEDPSQPDSTEPTTPTNYIKILNDSIKVITQQMDWDAAQKHCKRDDASLASFKTEWTQAYVELLALNLKTPLWIGLNKLQTNGYFRYVDGWDLKFTHWGKNEPSTNRACVYVDVDGKWKTAYCNQSMNSVCMTSTDVRPTESALFQGVCPFDPENNIGQNHFWLPFRGYCYMFFREEKEWSQASTSCIAHGGQLVSIEDPFEQEFILKNVKIFQDSYTSFWIGLFKTQKGEWQWLDKKVMDYSNFGEGQPKDHKYGEISTIDGTWKATKMWHDKPYICKTPKVLAQKPLPTVRNKFFHQGRSYTALIVVLVIAVIAIGAIIAVVLFKNCHHQLPIPDNLTSFDNPLFFNKQSEVDLVSTNVLAEKAVENTETLINV